MKILRNLTTSFFLIVSLSSAASAASPSIAEVQNAANLALKSFQTDHADHVSHFVGYKAWISGEDTKVLVYVDHDGMNMQMQYLCHKHDNVQECHAQ